MCNSNQQIMLFIIDNAVIYYRPGNDNRPREVNIMSMKIAIKKGYNINNINKYTCGDRQMDNTMISSLASGTITPENLSNFYKI